MSPAPESNGPPTWPREACDDCCKGCFDVYVDNLIANDQDADKKFHACCDLCERAYVAAMARGR